METVYKSKIGLELALPLNIVLGGTLVMAMFSHKAWPVFLIIGPLLAFIWYMFLSMKYSINGNQLAITCGFLFNRKLEISSITKIIETNNPLSSPAASLDRLDIRFNKSGSVLISPKEKQAFIDHLLSINPTIEVKYKKK